MLHRKTIARAVLSCSDATSLAKSGYRLTDALAEQRVVREITMFLHGHGVSMARAVRTFRAYGADAMR